MMDVYPVLYRTGWRNQDGPECTLNDLLQLQISQPVFERIGTHLRPKAIAHSAPRGLVSLKAAEPETGQSQSRYSIRSLSISDIQYPRTCRFLSRIVYR